MPGSPCGQAYHLPSALPQEPAGGRRLRPTVCDKCGDPVRPGVVWLGEDLPTSERHRAQKQAQTCDLFFTIGSSGLVYPAAHIPVLAKQAGAQVVQINPSKPSLDDVCTWSLKGAGGGPFQLACRFGAEAGGLSLVSRLMRCSSVRTS